jgi:hypothetical protein
MKDFSPVGAGNPTSTYVGRRRLLALGTSVLIAACAAQPATETTETSTPSARPLVAADLDVVCQDTMVTGSHFPKRVCRTKKEWGQIEDRSRSFTQGLQSDATKNLAPVPPGGFVNPTPIGGAPVY